MVAVHQPSGCQEIKKNRYWIKNKPTDVAEKIKAKLVLGELKVEKVNKNGPAFKALAERWLAMPHDWKESTREGYTSNLTNHVYPVFGKRPVDQISRKQLKLFFDDIYTKGLNARTLKRIRAPFRGVLSYAVESELIEANPFDSLRMNYKSNTPEIKPLNESEAAKVLEQAKGYLGGKYYPPLLLLLRTGMRIGEVLALQWTDIDFENRQIEVKRSWRNGVTSRTKNKKSRRVGMSPQLKEVLKNHRTSSKRKALLSGKPFSELVFNGNRKERLDRLSLKHALNHSTNEAEVRQIRIHDLRHSYATIRLMRGHNILDVSHQLGHSKTSITLDVYAHWIPGKFQSEVDDLDNLHLNCQKIKIP